MKVWITKYALSSGITEHDVKTTHDDSMISYVLGHFQYAYGEGKEWHKSFAGAQARAEKMRLEKIESLRKSIAKMEAIRFDL